MVLRVELRRAATADLRRVFYQIADENLTAARRTVRDLLLAGESLALLPERGSYGRALGTRELVAVRTYILIHHIGENMVSIPNVR